MVLANDLTGWAPLAFIRYPRPALDWCWLDGRELVDPFFCDTVTQAFRNPYALLARRRTALDELDVEDALPVVALICHISRSGSTLVSRTLAKLPELRVFSEPPALDGALRGGVRDEELSRVLRAFGMPWTSGRHTGIVIKLDCWNLASVVRLHRLLPSTPIFFLYREPLEVIVSQMMQPDAWTLPGLLPPEVLGLDTVTFRSMRREEICARAIAHFLDVGAGLVRSGVAHPVSYSELKRRLFDTILPSCGLNPDSVTSEEMERLTGLLSRQPELAFTADSDVQRMAASRVSRRFTEAITAEAWHKLQAAINEKNGFHFSH